MIIIAFSDKTSKILPRFFCKKFLHVAPILINNDKVCMYQFVSKNNIRKVSLKMRDIRVLNMNGWKFIYLPQMPQYDFHNMRAITCVQFTKNVIGIKNWRIQTPYGLYKYLK